MRRSRPYSEKRIPAGGRAEAAKSGFKVADIDATNVIIAFAPKQSELTSYSITLNNGRNGQARPQNSLIGYNAGCQNRRALAFCEVDGRE